MTMILMKTLLQDHNLDNDIRTTLLYVYPYLVVKEDVVVLQQRSNSNQYLSGAVEDDLNKDTVIILVKV